MTWDHDVKHTGLDTYSVPDRDLKIVSERNVKRQNFVNIPTV